MSFIVLQYPGVVRNVDKALVTLGGIAKLSEDHFKAGTVELDYHRENVYSRSTCSKRKRGIMLIVRARRRKMKLTDESTNAATSCNVETPVEVEILGFAHTIYQFNTMFDYQYLPMKRVDDNDQYKSILPNLVPQTMDAALTWFDPDPNKANQEIDLFLPPFVFSRFTAATYNMALCRETERRNPAKNSVPIGASLRADRKSYAVAVQGQDMFPDKPPVDFESLNDARYNLVEPNKRLQKVFEERPLWTKQAIVFITELDTFMIKFLLPKYAFYILSGPWGRMWCRFGYDPRTNRESRKYQTLMFNARNQPQLTSSARIPQLAAVRSQGETRPTRSNEPLGVSESVYVYKHGELPPYRQMWYQICDIKLPEAEALLQEEPIAASVADFSYGWFRQGALEELREAIKADFRETLRKLDREEFSDLEDDSQDDVSD